MTRILEAGEKVLKARGEKYVTMVSSSDDEESAQLCTKLHESADEARAKAKEIDAFRIIADNFLQSQNLAELPTEADGNCGEHAVSAVLWREGDTGVRDQQTKGWLRKAIASELRKDRGGIYSKKLIAGDTLETYSARMEVDGVFFDELAMQATSNFLRRPVKITSIYPMDSRFYISECVLKPNDLSTAEDALHLLHYDYQCEGNAPHFTALVQPAEPRNIKSRVWEAWEDHFMMNPVSDKVELDALIDSVNFGSYGENHDEGLIYQFREHCREMGYPYWCSNIKIVMERMLFMNRPACAEDLIGNGQQASVDRSPLQPGLDEEESPLQQASVDRSPLQPGLDEEESPLQQASVDRSPHQPGFDEEESPLQPGLDEEETTSFSSYSPTGRLFTWIAALFLFHAILYTLFITATTGINSPFTVTATLVGVEVGLPEHDAATTPRLLADPTGSAKNIPTAAVGGEWELLSNTTLAVMVLNEATGVGGVQSLKLHWWDTEGEGGSYDGPRLNIGIMTLCLNESIDVSSIHTEFISLHQASVNGSGKHYTLLNYSATTPPMSDGVKCM